MTEWGFSGGSDGKESACSAGDWGSIPGLGRSPGEEYDNPLQCSCLKNPLDRGDWQLQSMRSQKVRQSEQLKLTKQKLLTDTGNNEKETAFEERVALKYYGCVTNYPKISSFKQNKQKMLTKLQFHQDTVAIAFIYQTWCQLSRGWNDLKTHSYLVIIANYWIRLWLELPDYLPIVGDSIWLLFPFNVLVRSQSLLCQEKTCRGMLPFIIQS